MTKPLYLIIMSCLLAMPAGAQNSRRRALLSRTAAYAHKLDSLKNRFSSRITSAANRSMDVSDTANVVLSPYMYRLVGTGMYYSSAVKNRFGIDWNDSVSSSSFTPAINYRDEVNSGVDELLVSAYVKSPNHFTHYDNQYQNVTVVDVPQDAAPKAEQLDDIIGNSDNIKDVTEIVDDVDFNFKVTKPNFWKTTGKFSLQFTQNYFSQNWYKGGNNNGTMLSQLYLTANYNDQKKIQWDNSLDLRLGFVTTSSDSCHTFLTNNDKINLNSKVGLKAKDAWYYTFSLQAFTQFLPGYKTNDRKSYSAFLAPLDVNASIGMDFKPNLKRSGWSLSMALLPLSYKLRYISSSDENIHKVYSMVDKYTQHDFGSRLEYNHNFKLLSNLIWKTRLYYYTTYKYAEAEMENTFSFTFNKYISADFYTLWRFDDSRNPKYKDESLGYFQFKEYLTLGLAYSF